MQIEFHNREKEITEIQNILSTRPDLITFIYGPINSGKTELITHVINNLSGNYISFYVNLRGKFIRDYNDFMRVLFRFEKDEYDVLKAIAEQSIKFLKFKGIPVSESVLDIIFRERRSGEDVFEFLEEYMVKIAEKYTPVLVIDELQVIGDIEIDGKPIYRLFNFFVRLTKELHLCHVFVVTSDSLFIEKVYSEAMLQGRCRYLLVDDFDYEAVVEFLKKYGFHDDEIEKVWSYVGGKPIYLIDVVNFGVERVEEMLQMRISEIKHRLKRLREFGSEVEIEGKRYGVEYEKVVEALKKFVDRDVIDDEELDEVTKFYLVRNNVLFADPAKSVIKPQSRLDLLAIRTIF